MFVLKYLASSREPPNSIIIIINVCSSFFTLCAFSVLIDLIIPSSFSRPRVNVAASKPPAHFVNANANVNGPVSLSRYIDWLRAGRSGDRIPAGGEIFRTCPDRLWGPPNLLYNGYRVFLGGKERPGSDADP